MNPPSTVNRISTSSLLAALSLNVHEFRKPINHYNYDKCIEILGSMRENVAALGNPRIWQKFNEALDSTLINILQFKNSFNKFPYRTNLPQRAKWLELEFNSVTGNPYSGLKEHRSLFTETDGELKIWKEHKKKAAQHNVIGVARRAIRDFSTAVNREINQLNEFPAGKLAEPLRLKNCNLYSFVDECSQAVQVSQSRFGLGKELYPTISSLKELMLEFHGATTKEEWLEFYKSLQTRCRRLEKQSRIIYSKVLGYKLTADQHRRVDIYEETGLPDQKTIDQIRATMSDWQIDLEKKFPQKGFGRVYSEDEIRHFFVDCDASLFRVEIDNQTVGYYILFLNQNKFPAYVNGVMGELEKAGEDLAPTRGWTEMMVKTKEGAEIQKLTGINIYSLMHQAVADSLGSERIENGFAVVREGVYANLAKAAHIDRDWIETGIMVTLGQYTYQAIKLMISHGGYEEIPEYR